MKRLILSLSFLVFLTLLIFWGCSKENNDNSTDTLSVSIIQPENGDTVISTLHILAECGSTPDYVEFDFDTFDAVIDSTSPYSVSFDVFEYMSGTYSATAIAYWGETTRQYVVSFYIEHIECDSTEPVVLNGITIPEDRIARNSYGCVIGIDLSDMDISEPNCLNGIENYSATLETLKISHNDLENLNLSQFSDCKNLIELNVSYNNLTSIDLSPLSNCRNLKRIILFQNQLTEIDISPLSSCINLESLNLDNNSIEYIDITALSSCKIFNSLFLFHNNLLSIDLSPLSSCEYLTRIYLSDNQLTNIDLTPLWNLTLSYLYINGNPLDSASCAQVCDFITDHPSCDVYTDCDCGGKSSIIPSIPLSLSPRGEREERNPLTFAPSPLGRGRKKSFSLGRRI